VTSHFDAIGELLNQFNRILTYRSTFFKEGTWINSRWSRLKDTGTLVDASKEVGLEVNAEKTKYMLLSRHQNTGQNRDIKIVNRSFGNVSQFKYLGTTVTNQNNIQEEIKRRLNSGNACYHSVQNLLSGVKKLKN
jgi:Ser-tRNA(Ala) deacylase AlaX